MLISTCSAGINEIKRFMQYHIYSNPRKGFFPPPNQHGRRGRLHLRFEYQPGTDNDLAPALALGTGLKPELSHHLTQARVAHLSGEGVHSWRSTGETMELERERRRSASVAEETHEKRTHSLSFHPSPLLTFCSDSGPTSPDLAQRGAAANFPRAELQQGSRGQAWSGGRWQGSGTGTGV